jgi:hypothetical protein
MKAILSSILIVTASEAAKRSAILGAILISLPLSSLIALSFLWVDTQDTQKVIELSKGIVLMILPSVLFFFLLVGLLKLKIPYWPALIVSVLGMSLGFAGYVKALEVLGFKI